MLRRGLSGHRRLRWLVPAGAAGVIAVLGSGVLSANANPNLPAQSAAQLLASISQGKVAGFSGTVVEKASLGLPDLPSLSSSGSSSNSMLGLLTGSHTSRVWYGGVSKQRFALLDSLGEQDVFRNGTDLWQWDSSTHTATHTTLPKDAGTPEPSTPATMTPTEAAQQALAAIDPTTIVTTDRSATVAGRATYTLVLQPRSAQSTVGSVRISLDGKTRVPLSVQVIARGASSPAFDVSFTRVDFGVPDDSNFTFHPAAGVTVKQAASPSVGAPAPRQAALGDHVTSIGTGWTTVAKLTGVGSLTTPTAGAKDSSGSAEVSAVLAGLPEVSGSWGKGKLFRSALVNALLTDDGRAFVGAVQPDVLYQAAAKK